MQLSGSWLDALNASGATVRDGSITDFGDAAAERDATRAGDAVVSPLTSLASLHFSGADAIDFLHGQITTDLKGLVINAIAPGAYCTPKGRMLASFLVLREADGVRLLMDAGIAPGIHKRLQMYVLRAKVRIANESATHVLVGLAGRNTATALASAGLDPVPAPMHGGRDAAGDLWMALAGDRSIGLVPLDAAPQLWTRLVADARPVGPECWRWLDIMAGFPWISTATQDALVPQMANLDLLRGVSFTKGCYPGQEIVARTHHLGKVKRRMYLAHLETGADPKPGDPVTGEDLGGQASGVLVNSAASPDGGFDVLAVMHESTATGSRAHLRTADGPALDVRPLPYPAS